MAAIYDKTSPGPHEKVLILATREVHIRPFQATDWTDLRIGFFLSLTQPSPNDDNPSTDPTNTITETIAAGPGVNVPFTDRIQIGVTDSATGQVFLGYSNLPARARTISTGESMLVSSDIGLGTANKRYWRPTHGSPPPNGDNNVAHIIDGGRSLSCTPDGSQMHFVRDPATAGGYCTLFAIRLTRPDNHGRAKIITMQVKKTASGHSSDILFSTTPTDTVMQSQLESFPTTVNTLGPIELSQVPDYLKFYWPFSNSRLRIHCVGILKQA